VVVLAGTQSGSDQRCGRRDEERTGEGSQIERIRGRQEATEDGNRAQETAEIGEVREADGQSQHTARECARAGESLRVETGHERDCDRRSKQVGEEKEAKDTSRSQAHVDRANGDDDGECSRPEFERPVVRIGEQPGEVGGDDTRQRVEQRVDGTHHEQQCQQYHREDDPLGEGCL